jgi:hypothetical protein
LGVISKVEISGGQLAIANLLPSGQEGPTFFEAHGVSSHLEQVDLNAFIASAMGPRESLPTGHPRPGEGGRRTSLVYAPSPHPAAQGTLKAQSLRFGAIQATDIKSSVRLFAKQVFFDDVSLDLYGGRAAGDLSFNFTGENPRYANSARATAVDVAKLLEAFPCAHGKMTGKMEGSVKLSGEVTHSPDPLTGMRGTGQLSVRNGQLPSLQLNKNLAALVRLGNLGPTSGDPSSFSSMTADINTVNQRITSNKITIIGNGVGVDGSGSLTLAGAGSLDYQGVAKINAGQSALTNILVGLGGVTLANGRLSFPFSVTGTLQNPRFLLKMAAGAGAGDLLPNFARGTKHGTGTPSQNQPQPADLVQGLTDLFKKKPSQPPPKSAATTNACRPWIDPVPPFCLNTLALMLEKSAKFAKSLQTRGTPKRTGKQDRFNGHVNGQRLRESRMIMKCSRYCVNLARAGADDRFADLQTESER